MAHCSKCGIEFAEGIATCSKCGTGLPPRKPPTAVGVEESDGQPERGTGETKCVRIFHGPTAHLEANLAKNVLGQEGILCALQGEEMARIIPVPPLDVVQLLVGKEDAKEAAEILKDYFDSPQPVPPEDRSA
jgi:putative signal transducing protein